MPRAGRRSWGQGARPTSGFGTGWCPAGIRGPGRWDSLACYCQSPLLGPTPHQNPHFVWIRAHTAPATARGSRRRAAAWRTRTKHPNLKPTPFCRPGSRTASLGYEISSYGPTDGLARTRVPWASGRHGLQQRAILRCRPQFATALWTFLPEFVLRTSLYKPALPARDLRPALRTAAKKQQESTGTLTALTARQRAQTR